MGVERYKADKTKDWIGFHSSIDYGSVDWLTDLLFGHLGMYVLNVLFAVWSLLLVDSE